MIKRDFVVSFGYFLLWRIFITIFIYIGIVFVQSGENFLGGIDVLYRANPLFWSASNFDGTHYTRIARYGYEPLTHFFFPLYPLLMHLFSKYIFMRVDLFTLQLSSIIISNLFAFLSFWGFYKLLSIDFSKRIVNLAMLSLVLFPTSVYFGATYTESLFFASVVWSFYFFRRKKYLLSGVIGGISTATRIVGANLVVSYFSEFDIKNLNFKKVFSMILVLSGLFMYMLFLYKAEGNALLFNTYGSNFGEYRSEEIVLLPIVFYRYIFKILPNLNYFYFEGTFPILLELATAIGLLIASIIGFFRLRKSYFVFLIAGFIMPTLYNSFVSLPRYALVLFPVYILIAKYLINKNIYIKMLYLVSSTILMLIVSIMFTRGLWIA